MRNFLGLNRSASGTDRRPAQALLERGLRAEEAGRLADAIAHYRTAIESAPSFALAHLYLGIALRANGQVDAAVASYLRTVDLDPSHPAAHYNLGIEYLAQRNLDSAEACLRIALSLKDGFAEAWVALAELLESTGRYAEAIRALEKSVALRPDYLGALENLAALLQKSGRAAGSVSAYRRIAELSPVTAQTHFRLGAALQGVGEFGEAEASFRRAIAMDGHFGPAVNSLATVVLLQDPARVEEAESLYRRAIEIDPAYSLPHSNLGNVLQVLGRLTESEACLRRAVELNPDMAPAQRSLGNTLKDLGRVDEAIPALRKALELDPQDASAHHSLLMTLNYSAAYSREQVYAQHRTWARDFEAAHERVFEPHSNRREPGRRLRVGYVSPDFRRHSVAYFIEPVLASHERANVEVFCYSNVATPDPMTARLMALADHERSIAGVSSDVVAETIRADRIDILVDLAGHTAGNSLAVFARKPAPVQVTYLGYPNTTGLRTIDWRITDIHVDPPGDGDDLHSEGLSRLERTFLCFQPPAQAPDPGPLPMLSTGHVTFGSFNALPKITPEVMALWARLLSRLPGSRLILKSLGLSDAQSREHVARAFSRLGVSADRILVLPMEDTLQGHLARYRDIDIGLDPFPFNGTTTTLEALWMGIPVVALAGDRHAGRVGGSILRNAGLAELVAQGLESYIDGALALASDPRRLSNLRESLRERLASSPLLDARGFVTALESAYRRMWVQWCRSAT